PDSYHGSGCTLAAAIAGYLAHKLTLRDAIQQAQRFTWEALSHGTRMGFGQHIPNRSYWNKQQP
ncbi:MAG TPA: hydroxymethylpyrimidine/phosphomethylpyrimidine kinase, partial [Gammaproteobacteria bacterium]|nr:hydroxymethylpyrimidine/phosphomethylpyrimidine kinase [Gammaproteobacteria bacterium]